jgi:hypothetical protein
MQPIHYRLSFAACGALLIIATAPHQYFFYNYLRGMVVLIGLVLGYRAWRTKQHSWFLLSATCIILFNSWFKVEFPKPVWIPIDLIVGLLLFAAGYLLGKPFKIFPTKVDGDEIIDIASVTVPDLDRTEILEYEPNDASRVGATVLIFVIFLIFYSMAGMDPIGTGCLSWVQDQNGGFCDG